MILSEAILNLYKCNISYNTFASVCLPTHELN